MTAETNIDMSGWIHEQLEQASPDLLRSMVQVFAEALMGAQADAEVTLDREGTLRERTSRSGC